MNSDSSQPVTGAKTAPGADATTQRLRTRTGVEWFGICLVFAQLILVALVLRQLDILSPAFRRVFYLASVGFVAHHFLPKQYRLSFFSLFCCGVFFVVLGGSGEHRLVGFGLAMKRIFPFLIATFGLIGLCLLPIRFWKRLLLVCAAAVVIGLFRKGVFGPESLSLIWPVLASLFMFRLIVFLYDLATWKARPKWSEALAYFLLFPNSCSTLFPVVDFKTLCQSHYNAEALTIYNRGVQWIIRGVLQLCAHRLVTQLLSLRPEYVTDGLSLIQFILASTFVYLQVSGLFHLVVGMLLLFGFNLPETNQRYFLASSFTDYWRRVNIYWKNFIMKVVYYPLYFRIKGWGATTALVVATLWAFFVTWALHLYQTWWLKGHLGFSWSDVLFWSILAALVLLNSLWEMKRGRQRKLASGYSLRGALGLALRTAGTFACISLLWSLWSTPTITQWIGLLRHADGQTLLWGLATLAGIMIATAIFEVLPANRKSKPTTPVQPTSPILRMVRPVAIGAAPLLLLLLVQQPAFQNRFDSLSAQVWYDVLNTGDSTAMMDQQVSEGGYYARLTSVDRADRALWETVMVTRLPDIPVGPATASRPVRDYRFEAAIVNVKTQAYDTMFETNPQGMRDRNYAFEKPTGTVRIALLGSSHTMGYGVRLEETFDSVLEERLNAQPPPGAEGVKFEVLNFAFSRLSPLSQISVIRTEAARFQPDIVVLVAQTEDDNWVTYDLARCLRERLPLPYEFPLRIMKEARVTAHTERNLAHRRLIPHRPELLGWSYERIVDECRRIDALPAAFFVPVPNDVIYNGLTNVMVQTNLMARAGFVTGDLSGLYDGLDPTEFMLSDAFHHCNARGHRLMADALYNAFVTDTNINLAHLSRKALGGLSGTPHLSRRTDRTDTNTN